jgi:hypothetical protein
VIILAMQTLDNSIRLRPKRSRLGLGPGLQTEEDADNPNPRFIEVADRVTRRAAEKLDATPQSGLTEALLNTPTTAHIFDDRFILVAWVDFLQSAFLHFNFGVSSTSSNRDDPDHGRAAVRRAAGDPLRPGRARTSTRAPRWARAWRSRVSR